MVDSDEDLEGETVRISETEMLRIRAMLSGSDDMLELGGEDLEPVSGGFSLDAPPLDTLESAFPVARATSGWMMAAGAVFVGALIGGSLTWLLLP